MPKADHYRKQALAYHSSVADILEEIDTASKAGEFDFVCALTQIEIEQLRKLNFKVKQTDIKDLYKIEWR